MDSIRSKVKIKRGRKPKSGKTNMDLHQSKMAVGESRKPASEAVQGSSQPQKLENYGAQNQQHMFLKNESLDPNKPQSLIFPQSIFSGEDQLLGKHELEESNEDGGNNDELSKMKNRESARNSRKRKKLYIELLEKQVIDLTMELNKYKKMADENAKKRLPLPTSFAAYLEERAAMLDKLEKKLENGEKDIDDLVMLIDSLRLRFGSSGEKWLSALEVLFKHFIDSLLPKHVKYLLYSAQEGKDMFAGESNEGAQSGFYSELSAYVGLNEDEHKAFKKFRTNMLNEKRKMNNAIYEMTNLKAVLIERAKSLQKLFDELRNSFSPVQVAKFLIFVERKKRLKELLPDNLWCSMRPHNFKSESSEDFNFLGDDFVNHYDSGLYGGMSWKSHDDFQDGSNVQFPMTQSTGGLSHPSQHHFGNNFSMNSGMNSAQMNEIFDFKYYDPVLNLLGEENPNMTFPK